VKGGAKAKLAGLLQLALVDAAAKEKAQLTEFVVEGRFSRDDFGGWRVSYTYDRAGPLWRLDLPEGSSRAAR
jgi:hypothetical protein